MISAKESLTGKLNSGIIHEYPELENLEITPSIKEQHFKSEKYGYNNVVVNAIESKELNVTPGVTEQVKEGLYNKVTVAGDSNLIPENIAKDIEIFGVVGKAESKGEENAIINEKKYSSIPALNSNYHILNRMIVKAPSIDTSNWTSGYYLFADCESLKEIPLMDTSKMTDMRYMFIGCSSIETINSLDTSNVTTMQHIFHNCTSLKNLPILNTEKVRDMSHMFNTCKSLEEIPSFNTGNVTDMASMFSTCSLITIIPNLDTSNVSTFANTFYNCISLQTIPKLNLEKAKNLYRIFNNCSELENLGGFLDLGKAFTQTTTNYNHYKLDLSYSPKLTHDSLMNIINELYDLNLTYNVANGGTLYTQQLVLGSTNMAKLTTEEIEIATNKGWSVS